MEKYIKIDGLKCRHCQDDIQDVLMTYSCVEWVQFEEDVLILTLNEDMKDDEIIENIENCGNYKVIEIKVAS